MESELKGYNVDSNHFLQQHQLEALTLDNEIYSGDVSGRKWQNLIMELRSFGDLSIYHMRK